MLYPVVQLDEFLVTPSSYCRDFPPCKGDCVVYSGKVWEVFKTYDSKVDIVSARGVLLQNINCSDCQLINSYLPLGDLQLRATLLPELDSSKVDGPLYFRTRDRLKVYYRGLDTNSDGETVRRRVEKLVPVTSVVYSQNKLEWCGTWVYDFKST